VTSHICGRNTIDLHFVGQQRRTACVVMLWRIVALFE